MDEQTGPKWKPWQKVVFWCLLGPVLAIPVGALLVAVLGAIALVIKKDPIFGIFWGAIFGVLGLVALIATIFEHQRVRPDNFGRYPPESEGGTGNG